MKIAASQRLMLLVFLCLNFSSGVFSQTITLGSGTDINSITTNSEPFISFDIQIDFNMDQAYNNDDHLFAQIESTCL